MLTWKFMATAVMYFSFLGHRVPTITSFRFRLFPDKISRRHGLRAFATSYYTCRHTFEKTLIEELALQENIDAKDCSSPCPGLVKVVNKNIDVDGSMLDPAYALQVLPNTQIVEGASIKELAKGVLTSLNITHVLLLQQQKQLPEKGTLAVHVLVPDILKGRPATRAQWWNRGTRVAEKILKDLRKTCICARPARLKTTDDDQKHKVQREESDQPTSKQKWVLQLLLLSPEKLIASLTLCCAFPATNRKEDSVGLLGTWPNWNHVGGFAPASAIDPEIESDSSMPGSAYRKLLEAFACLGYRPNLGDTAVDLGSSPGSWTQALRRLGCKTVHSVDRSALASHLMKDKGIKFHQGDAFTFSPPGGQNSVDWLVSDIIAFPERVIEIIERWCSEQKSHRMILTMKFKGASPDWQSMSDAKSTAAKHGYTMRAKHFFANKNEVTLMLVPSCPLFNENTHDRKIDTSDSLGKSKGIWVQHTHQYNLQ